MLLTPKKYENCFLILYMFVTMNVLQDELINLYAIVMPSNKNCSILKLKNINKKRDE
jgi:hypothetical protein